MTPIREDGLAQRHATRRRNRDGKDTVGSVAIIGAGIGGIYLAAEPGHRRVFRRPSLCGVGVEGEKGGFASVERATSDLRTAVDGADVVIVVTGGNAQPAVRNHSCPCCATAS